MNYYSQALTNERWGIYQEQKLLATIGCYKTCQRILTLLKASKSRKIRTQQDFHPLKQNNKTKASSKSRTSKTKLISRTSSLV